MNSVFIAIDEIIKKIGGQNFRQGAKISKYLGYSKVSITLGVYSHFYKSELENIIERIIYKKCV